MTSHVRAGFRDMPISHLGPANRYPKFTADMPPMELRSPDGLLQRELDGLFLSERVRLLPYTPQSTYDRAQTPGKMPTVELENDHMRAIIYPDYGGRLASLYDKVAKRELLFDNPVFQPANLAIRDAWFSGGIEWNSPIYGHSLLTCSRVYVGRGHGEHGEFMRIYEFDRTLETAWQIDLSLDPDQPGLWIHVKVFNLNDHPVDYYWWTNMAVPQTAETRVIANDVGRCVQHTPDQAIRGYDYPRFSDFDASYPIRFDAHAASIYLDLAQDQMPWIAYADKNGQGLVHASTRTLRGRKMFAWGATRGGQRWMDLLSQPGKGNYLEIQGGLQPTQLQTIPIPPGVGAEWTEYITSLNVPVKQAHDPDYLQAQAAVRRQLDDQKTEPRLNAQHDALTLTACRPVEENLSKGSAWGAIYERATGKRITESMTFDAALSEDEAVWDQLAGGASQPGENAVGDWIVLPRWAALLQREIDAGRGTWSHHLHLGVYLLEHEKLNDARAAFVESNALHENDYAWRNLACLERREGNIPAAKEAYQHAMAIAGPHIELAREYSELLYEHDSADAAEAFVHSLPNEVADHERLRILLARIAAGRGDITTVDRILKGRFNTIREKETGLTDIWYAARYKVEADRLGRELTKEEKKAYRAEHKPPAEIDFRMISLPSATPA